MKKSKKSVIHVLGMSILLALSSTSYAELVVNNNPASTSANSSSASLNWSASDASQLMQDDESRVPLSAKITKRNKKKTIKIRYGDQKES